MKYLHEIILKENVHKTLTKKLFDSSDHMLPEVRAKLLEICEAFLDFSKVPREAVDSIILTGSSASYNYSSHSDLDEHIIIEKSKIAAGEFTDSYLQSQKSLWAAKHKISVRGYPVELYFQDKDDVLIAQSQYDLLNDHWIKHPVDMRIAKNKFQEVRIQSDKYSKIVDDLLAANDTV